MMPDVIKEILRLNPHIKKAKLKESILMAQQLAESGVKMSEYNLASPFSRRRTKGEKNVTYGKHIRKYRKD